MITRFIIGCLLFSALGAETLYICVPSINLNKNKIKKEMSGLSIQKVRVFDKITSLNRALKKSPNAVVIAPTPYLTLNDNIKTVLDGYKGSSLGEPYLIVTANPNVTLDNISSQKVGVFDTMGRKNFKKFFQKYFDISGIKIKRVNKKEDLLTLLGVDMVDAIALFRSDFEALKKETNIPLKVLVTSNKNIGYLAIGNSGNVSKKNVLALQKMKKSFLSILSLSKWEVQK